MISNYYTLQFVVSTLNPAIVGRRIAEAYTQRADELVISFQEEMRSLLILCSSGMSTLYLRRGVSRARRNSALLLKECAGRRVDAVQLHSSDRLVQVSLEGDLALAARLYGAHANLFLTDNRGTILDAFKSPREVKGSMLEIPGASPLYSRDRFREACARADSGTVAAALRRSHPTFGGTLTHESLERARVDGSLPASLASAEQIDAIDDAVRSVESDIAHPAPRVYRPAGGPPRYLSLIPLRLAAALEEEMIPDIHDCIQAFLSGQRTSARREKETDAVVAPLRNRLEKARRTAQAISREAEDPGRALRYERYGSALMGALSVLRKGQTTFDTDIDGEHVSIPLDPSLSPIENAQRYFGKAKRARSATEESSRRLQTLLRQIERGEHLLARAGQDLVRDGAARFLRENARELEEFGIGTRSRPTEDVPFRIFTVDGGFEVWAGKNGVNNDLLTLRHARPDDLWFHARGGSGSHVVLRAGTGAGAPGKRACEEAAAIAAYYSRMRTAGTVAVAMTERRYVRKPRGSPPGTVAIEREKVIFVKPGLPRRGAI